MVQFYLIYLTDKMATLTVAIGIRRTYIADSRRFKLI